MLSGTASRYLFQLALQQELDDAGIDLTDNGERLAGQFVLSVWNPDAARDGAFECGGFDLHEAMQTWDGDHRRAFVAWVAEPWWP